MAAVARECGLSDQRVGDVKLAVSEAVANVVRHAYSGQDPGQVVGTAHLDDGALRIVIADTGRGMPAEVLESLFTYQATSRKHGGTGLGTKIVKDVVNAHGGFLSVESTPGAGTTFYLTLPVDGPAFSFHRQPASPEKLSK